MPVFIFKGDAWPKGDKMSSPPIEFGWEEDGGSKASMLFEMTDSVITVRCNSPSSGGEDPHAFGRAVAQVQLFSQCVLDTICFMSGSGVTAVIHTVIREGGEPQELRLHDASLVGLGNAFAANEFGEAISFIVGEPLLLLALSDLHSGLTMPGQLFVGCGRAIDCIRKIISNDDPDTGKGWAAVRTALNIGRPFIQFIMDESKDPRHGARAKGGPSQHEVKIRAWVVVNRGIIYMRRGRVQLTAPEFPEL